MENLLDNRRLESAGSGFDPLELNTALNLIYYFTKKRICSLKIGDVYDGNDIIPEIIFKIRETPRTVEDELKAILTFHIDHLQQTGIALDQEDPLFPTYFGIRGEKKLQRHVRQFSSHRDLHNIKRFLVNAAYQAAEDNQKGSVRKIAESTGKSEKAIAQSLGIKPQPQRTNKKLYEKPNYQIFKLLDFIYLMPETLLLDKDYVQKLMCDAFEILSLMTKNKHDDINEVMYIVINRINKCINGVVEEIEKPPMDHDKKYLTEDNYHELIKKLENLKPAHKLSDSLNDFDDDDINTLPLTKPVPFIEKVSQDPPPPQPEITDIEILHHLEELFARIETVRNMVSDDTWKKWEESSKHAIKHWTEL